MQMTLELSHPTDGKKRSYPVVLCTASRCGLTEAQAARLATLIRRIGPREVIHGDCIGGDADCHKVVMACSQVIVGVYPSNIPSQRAFCRGAQSRSRPRPPLERNRLMVHHASLILAFPSGFTEEVKSGTWATIRYARRIGRPVVVIWPDGRLEHNL